MAHEIIQGTALRIQNEGDRSEEFKNARERLLTGVNDWLQTVAAIRDSGGLVKGLPVSHQARITETQLGLSSRGKSTITEHQPGVSLSGDGKEKPFIFQCVSPVNDNGVSEIIQVQGTDPLANQLHSDARNSDRYKEKIAEFSVQLATTLGRDESYFAFTIYGDGSMHRETLTDYASNLKATDAAMAQQAFDLIKADIQLAER